MKSKPLFIHKDFDKYFYNRKKDIKKLKYQINSLEYSLPQQILLTGYRGVGKTYLLKKVINETENNIVCVYMDISQVYALNEEELNIENVLLELLKNMNQTIKNNNYENIFKREIVQLIDNIRLKKYNFQSAAEIFEIPIPNTETNYKKLSQFVMEFPQKIVEKIDEIDGFLIVIDEFQILRKIDKYDKFFWLIRSFNQFQHNVSYIFTGSISRSSELIEQLNGESGAFSGRMSIMNIEPFSKEETRSYFKECMPEISFTDDGFDRFYQCTRGIPLYINSFYNMMDSNEIYDAQLVKDTFFMNMNQILIMWIRIWSSLNKEEKKILLRLVDEDSLTWSQLLDKMNISRGTFNKYVKNLRNKGLLAYNNRMYSIEDQMLKTWLKHEKEINGIYPL